VRDDEQVEDTVLRPRDVRGAESGPSGSPAGAPGADDSAPDDDTVLVGRGRHVGPGVGGDRRAGGGRRVGIGTAARPADARPVPLPRSSALAPPSAAAPPSAPAPPTAWAPPSAPAGRSASVLPPAVSAPLPGADTVAEPVVPRPPAPSVRIGDRVLRLDRPVLVGRRPTLPRVVHGPVPELVTVASPAGLVSSSHLLLHSAGSSAVVDDLHSTNGTTIRPPGAPPHRMPAGASIVVLTGTVVDIGDGNTIEVLSPFVRSVPPGGRDPSGPTPVLPSAPGPSRIPRERP
jgi:hypothetical protein